MGVRDDDLKKLLAYAKGVGADVKFERHKRGDWAGAYWDFENPLFPKIILATWPRQTKTSLILSLVHELGHHMDWIHNNRAISARYISAAEKEFDRKSRRDKVIAKKWRQVFYKSEMDGLEYHEMIAKESQIKLPRWKVIKERESDRWIYTIYLKTGNVPTSKQLQQKQKGLRKRYYEDI